MSAKQSDTLEVRPFRWEELEFGETQEGSGESMLPEERSGVPLSPEEQAEQLLAEARRQAAAAVEAAQREAVRIRQVAMEKGLAEGRADGAAGIERVVARLEALATELAAYKTSLFAEAREQVVELVLALVGKLLGPLAEDTPGAVLRVVERALQLLSDRETLTIRVHPEDLKAIIDAKPHLLETIDGIRKLTVLEDPSVRAGGCLVQTPTAEIDARLETQLQELARSIRSL